MTEKNTLRKRIRIFSCTVLAASLCAGLALTGCGAGKTQQSASQTAGTAATAPASEKGSEAETTAQALSTSAAAEAAAAATTGAEVSDPDGAETAEEITFSAVDKGLVIVLDPGHASQVPGTMEPIGPGATETKEADTEGAFGSASGLHEYDLTMDVAQKLRAELEERGYEVVLTHRDTFNPISCSERAAVANENKADAFIRIHANSSENTEAEGAMTVCITKDNPYHPELYSASARLSEILLDSYCSQTGAKREYVWETDSMTGNNWAEVPTSLIELGYMSNPDEDLRMNQDSYQKVMCTAIADGLDKWFAQMPEDELSMHPSLTEEKADSADTSSTAEAADEMAGTEDEADNTDASPARTDAETASDQQGSTADTADSAAPAAATPAGASSGNVAGVSADPDSTNE